jgi:hypothetical protein
MKKGKKRRNSVPPEKPTAKLPPPVGRTFDPDDKRLILFEDDFRTRAEIEMIKRSREISKRVTARRVRSYKPIVFLSNPKSQ